MVGLEFLPRRFLSIGGRNDRLKYLTVGKLGFNVTRLDRLDFGVHRLRLRSSTGATSSLTGSTSLSVGSTSGSAGSAESDFA